MDSRQGSFVSQDGSFTRPVSPWGTQGGGGGGGYFVPMNVQYAPMSPVASPVYQPPQGPGFPQGHFLPVPPAQLLPHHSYLIEDPIQSREVRKRKEFTLSPLTVQKLTAALIAVSALALVAQLVVSGLVLVKDHGKLSLKFFWGFALCGLVSSLVSLSSMFWGTSCAIVARLGLFLSATTGGAVAVYWVCTGKEGMAVLMCGQALLSVALMLLGNTFHKNRNGEYQTGEDFSFGQPFLGNEEELQVGQ